MFQQLTSATSAQAWAIGSMLFFMAVFALVVLRLVGSRREEMEHCARIPLDDEPPATGDDAGQPALPSSEGR